MDDSMTLCRYETETTTSRPCGSFVVQGVSATTREGKRILKDVSLSLEFGTVTILCGHSGSGKTTLLHALCLQKTDLSISFESGRSQLRDMSKAFLRQNSQLNDGFGNVLPIDYLRLTASLFEVPNHRYEKIRSLCEELYSPAAGDSSSDNPFFTTPIKSLSGGQHRVLVIAATLLLQPQLLLLDEPLSGLDIVSCDAVASAVRQLASALKCAVILTAHFPPESLVAKADQLLVMQSGSLVQESNGCVNGLIPSLVVACNPTTFPSDEVERISTVDRWSPGESSSEEDLISGHRGNLTDQQTNMNGNDVVYKTTSLNDLRLMCKQATAIARRMHYQLGWDFLGGEC
jgi:ABC-type multidrug transport system ATPase subunit